MGVRGPYLHYTCPLAVIKGRTGKGREMSVVIVNYWMAREGRGTVQSEAKVGLGEGAHERKRGKSKEKKNDNGCVRSYKKEKQR